MGEEGGWAMWNVEGEECKMGYVGGTWKEESKPLTRTGRRCGDNIKIDLERVELEDVVRLNVACNMEKLWTFVSEIIYHQVA